MSNVAQWSIISFNKFELIGEEEKQIEILEPQVAYCTVWRG